MKYFPMLVLGFAIGRLVDGWPLWGFTLAGVVAAGICVAWDRTSHQEGS